METLGQKRQMLINQAKGEYICFVDDLDCVSSDHINDIIKIISPSIWQRIYNWFKKIINKIKSWI